MLWDLLRGVVRTGKPKWPIIVCPINGFVWPAAKGKWSTFDFMDSAS